MAPVMLMKFLGWTEVVLWLAALGLLVAKKQWRNYWPVGSFLAVEGVGNMALLLLQHARLERHVAYSIYFRVYWMSYALQAALAMVILYHLLRQVTLPLSGVRRLGTVLFGCAAAIVLVSGIWAAYAANTTGIHFALRTIAQMQLGQSVLALCVLGFVWVAIGPLGLAYRGKSFGVSLGLGLLATTALGQAMFASSSIDIFGALVDGIAACGVPGMWVIYFAMREPERRVVALAPDSRWMQLNRMGLAWGSGQRG